MYLFVPNTAPNAAPLISNLRNKKYSATKARTNNTAFGATSWLRGISTDFYFVCMSTCVRRANKATSSQLSSVLPKVFDLKGSRYAAQVSTSSDLLDVDRQSVWELFEQNMRPMYVGSSMGWDPPSKKEELFHRDSRFILLRRSQEQDGADPLSEEPPIVAYSMFRFLIEDDECVLYCYELQVAQGGRRSGIGKTLMQYLCDIAREWDMQKVMLTVFKENQMALLFYKAMGFDTVDADSDLNYEDDVDYWIMFKDCCRDA